MGSMIVCILTFHDRSIVQHVTQWLKFTSYLIVQKSVLEIGCLSTYVVAMGEPAVPIPASRRASSRSVTASRRGSSKSVDQKVQNTLQGLHFDSVSIDVADKRILWDVTGHALPGRVLAIMGPSGEPDSKPLCGISALLSY